MSTTWRSALAPPPRALPPLGEVSADGLPAALAEALTGWGAGQAVGPLRDGLGWHVAYVEAVLPAAEADYAVEAPRLRAELRGAARRRAFGRWLERRRAELVVGVPGFEHPADPGQPDHQHRH